MSVAAGFDSRDTVAANPSELTRIPSSVRNISSWRASGPKRPLRSKH
jgi:hypothetical protein